MQGVCGMADSTKPSACRGRRIVFQTFNSCAAHDLDREQATVRSPLSPLPERMVSGTVQCICECRAWEGERWNIFAVRTSRSSVGSVRKKEFSRNHHAGLWKHFQRRQILVGTLGSPTRRHDGTHHVETHRRSFGGKSQEPE